MSSPLVRTLCAVALLLLPAAGVGLGCDPTEGPSPRDTSRTARTVTRVPRAAPPATASDGGIRPTPGAGTDVAGEGRDRGACDADRVTVTHVKHARIDQLMDLLELKPGMTLLDIGTGDGEFAYRFAERVGPTGRVFATDIDAKCTTFVAAEAKRRGLGNLETVLVTKEGVDAFYGKQHYDRITLFHVYYYLSDRIAYMKEMRAHLKEGGRVAILYSKKVYPFSEEEFSDFDGFVAALAREPGESPFLAALRPSTRALLQERPPGATDPKLRRAIVEDLNQMLDDRSFHRGFFGRKNRKRAGSLAPGERDFVNWLLMGLEEAGALEPGDPQLSPEQRRAVRKVNRLLIMQRFRKFLKFSRGREFSPFRVGDRNRQTSKLFIRREMNHAGFEQVGDHDLSTYYDLLVFAPHG